MRRCLISRWSETMIRKRSRSTFAKHRKHSTRFGMRSFDCSLTRWLPLQKALLKRWEPHKKGRTTDLIVVNRVQVTASQLSSVILPVTLAVCAVFRDWLGYRRRCSVERVRWRSRRETRTKGTWRSHCAAVFCSTARMHDSSRRLGHWLIRAAVLRTVVVALVTRRAAAGMQALLALLQLLATQKMFVQPCGSQLADMLRGCRRRS